MIGLIDGWESGLIDRIDGWESGLIDQIGDWESGETPTGNIQLTIRGNELLV